MRLKANDGAIYRFFFTDAETAANENMPFATLQVARVFIDKFARLHSSSGHDLSALFDWLMRIFTAVRREMIAYQQTCSERHWRNMYFQTP